MSSKMGKTAGSGAREIIARVILDKNNCFFNLFELQLNISHSAYHARRLWILRTLLAYLKSSPFPHRSSFFFFFSWFDMSSLGAFDTYTSDNDWVSVEKMVPPVETYDMITTRDVSKLCEDISSLYLNEKFSDVILVLDGEKLHAHKVRFITYADLYRNNLFCQHFKGNSCEM
jgi:hypothetical protein